MPQEDNRAAEMDEPEEVSCMIFPSCYELSKLMHPVDQALESQMFTKVPQCATIVETRTGVSAAFRSLREFQ